MQDENAGNAVPQHVGGSAPGIQGRRLLGNSIRSILIGLLAMVPALVLPAVYSRTMPPGDLAAWLYAASIAAWVVSFHLGIGPATSALVARQGDNPHERAALLITSVALSILAAVVACVGLIGLNHAGFFGGQEGGKLGSANLELAIDLAVVGSALVMPLHPISGYFTGTFQVGRIWPVNLVHKAALTVFGILAAVAFQTSTATAVAHALAGLITLVMLMSLMIGEVRRCVGGATRPFGEALARTFGQHTLSVLALALPAALSGLAQLPLSGLHAVIVANYVPSALVGYAVLVPALSLAGGLIWSVASNLLPEMSAAFAGSTHGHDHFEARHRVIADSVAITGLALVGATAIGAVMVPFFLHISVSGNAVAGHERALGAYAIALTMRQLSLPTSLAFFAINGPWRGLVPTGLEALVSMGLAWSLTPLWGLAGLVIAILAGAWTCAGVTPWLLARDRKERGPEFRRLCRSYALSLGAGTVLALLALSSPVPYMPGVAAGGALLCAVLTMTVLPPELRHQLANRVQGLVRRSPNPVRPDRNPDDRNH